MTIAFMLIKQIKTQKQKKKTKPKDFLILRLFLDQKWQKIKKSVNSTVEIVSKHGLNIIQRLVMDIGNNFYSL